MSEWKQEPDVVPARPIVAALIAALIATALGTAIAWRLADCSGPAHDRSAGAAHPHNRVPPEVSAVETTQFEERAQGLEDRRAAEAWLSSFGWVDRERRIVHIPIESAIDLYLRRHGGER
jgi:hypothetical protein